MSVVYSLYDALVSIKAVIDAMERELMGKIATKSDLEHVREVLSKDLAKVGELLSKDIVTVELRMDKKLSDLGDRLTMRLGGLMAAMIGAATALISAVQYFT